MKKLIRLTLAVLAIFAFQNVSEAGKGNIPIAPFQIAQGIQSIAHAIQSAKEPIYNSKPATTPASKKKRTASRSSRRPSPAAAPNQSSAVVSAPAGPSQSAGSPSAQSAAVSSSTTVRIGAICNDGTQSSATGRGACSHHGGVSSWLYSSPVSRTASQRQTSHAADTSVEDEVQVRGGESSYPVSGDRADNNSATSPSSLVGAHVLTAREVETAKRDFAKMVNTLSSTNKDSQAEESGRLDAEALANVAKQYEYLEHSRDWWSFWFIKTYGDEEDLAKKIALRRYGNDEAKVDPYVDSFVERYKAIIDDGRSQFAKQEFDKLKFFINQPVSVWNNYYGPSVSEGHWHRWKTDRFVLDARTYAGKVEAVSVTASAGLAYCLPDEITALGESLGLKMLPKSDGWSGENEQLYVNGSLNGVTIGTPQSRKRELLDWDDLKDLEALDKQRGVEPKAATKAIDKWNDDDKLTDWNADEAKSDADSFEDEMQAAYDRGYRIGKKFFHGNRREKREAIRDLNSAVNEIIEEMDEGIDEPNEELNED